MCFVAGSLFFCAWTTASHGQEQARSAPIRVAAGPDISGRWGHNGFGFETPYVTPQGNLIDGYKNPFLKPWSAEVVMKNRFTERSGRLFPNSHTTCWPDGVPGVITLRETQILQTPAEIVIVYQDNQQARHIYLDRPHSNPVAPSWYGESVGHFEGDTLVVDTVGFTGKPQATVDRHGVPHTRALHVVERFRVIDAVTEDPRIAITRGFEANARLDTVVQGTRTLQLVFTVDDPGSYKQPWSTTQNYKPLSVGIEEDICAENNRHWQALIPTAEMPDF
jgi:hypothetical protein